MANKTPGRGFHLIVIEACVIVLMFTGLNLFLLRETFPHSPISAWFMVEGIVCFILSGIYAVGYREGNFLNPYNRVRNFGIPDRFRSYPRFAIVVLIAGAILFTLSLLPLSM